MNKKIALAAVGAALLGGTIMATAPSAQAATAHNGVCESGEFCYYFNSDRGGSLSDFRNSSPNLGEDGSGNCHKFNTPGKTGFGVCVKNNAASVWNRTGKAATVFFNSNYGGVFHRIAAGGLPNLKTGVKNQNASHIVGDSALKFPVATTQAHIKNRSPHWCYTSNANCHHDYNAADIFAATGKKVVSPVQGTVKTVRVRSGCPGSTVTVKDAHKRLWYFAHLDNSPGPQVAVGQSVSKGTVLGFVGTSTHACGTPAHLHIDMMWNRDSRVECSGSGCSSFPFVNNQPLLREAFAKLPS